MSSNFAKEKSRIFKREDGKRRNEAHKVCDKRCRVNIELVMKVAGVGMIVTVVCQILSKAGRDEQSTLVSITGIVIILMAIVEEIGELFASLRDVFGL